MSWLLLTPWVSVMEPTHDVRAMTPELTPKANLFHAPQLIRASTYSQPIYTFLIMLRGVKTVFHA